MKKMKLLLHKLLLFLFIFNIYTFTSSAANLIEINRLAQQGDVNAQFNLAKSYMEHKDTNNNDVTQALIWAEKAAKQGHIKAMVLAGHIYYDETYNEHSYSKAYKWFKEAAEKGDADGYYGLSIMYHNGHGVQKDTKKANDLRLKAAQNGSSGAQYVLAVMLAKTDPIESTKWFESAAKIEAEKGDLDALFGTATMLNFYASETPQNHARAFKWFKVAAEKGHPPSQWQLGTMYYEGAGVKQDYNKAIEWYKKSADQDFTMALLSLGHMYQSGTGTKQDYNEAIFFYTKAVELGDSNAYTMLGFLYSEKNDYFESLKWFKKAAEHDDGMAQLMIGYMYLDGEGVRQSYSIAKEWFGKSCDNGEQDGCDQYKSLKMKGH